MAQIAIMNQAQLQILDLLWHFAHLEKIKIAKKCGDKLDCISFYRIFARVKIRKL